MTQGDSLNLVCRDGSGDCVLYSQTWNIIVRGLKTGDVFTEYNTYFPGCLRDREEQRWG